MAQFAMANSLAPPPTPQCTSLTCLSNPSALQNLTPHPSSTHTNNRAQWRHTCRFACPFCPNVLPHPSAPRKRHTYLPSSMRSFPTRSRPSMSAIDSRMCARDKCACRVAVVRNRERHRGFVHAIRCVCIRAWLAA
jgi:hypothetical protein